MDMIVIQPDEADVRGRVTEAVLELFHHGDTEEVLAQVNSVFLGTQNYLVAKVGITWFGFGSISALDRYRNRPRAQVGGPRAGLSSLGRYVREDFQQRRYLPR